jgi:type IV secretory pathway TraG/TraD family ATPase VirD4
VGAWRAGYRSFPAIYQLFSLPLEELIRTLRSHENPSSKQLANFLDGRSHNADTVLASIVGAMTSFLSDSVMRVMGNSELNLKKLFRKPVCLHMEMPEAKMETLLVLYQMFARAVTDELIDQAEKYPRKIIPATLFYDDLPSMGRILTPSRMMTMRSRGIGTVSGVQSLSSLEACYGSASRALIDNIHTSSFPSPQGCRWSPCPPTRIKLPRLQPDHFFLVRIFDLPVTSILALGCQRRSSSER